MVYIMISGFLFLSGIGRRSGGRFNSRERRWYCKAIGKIVPKHSPGQEYLAPWQLGQGCKDSMEFVLRPRKLKRATHCNLDPKEQPTRPPNATNASNSMALRLHSGDHLLESRLSLLLPPIETHESLDHLHRNLLVALGA